MSIDNVYIDTMSIEYVYSIDMVSIDRHSLQNRHGERSVLQNTSFTMLVR